jgi:hypothetical protein
MRIIRIAIVVLVSFVAISCTCTAEKGALRRLDGEHEKFFAKYLKYVDQDAAFGGPGLSEDQRKKARDDERKNVQALRDIVGALKKSLGE